MRFIQCAVLVLLLLLSGCSMHHQYAMQELNSAEPRYASIKNGYLEYYRFGHGSPIILIAGYATDVTSWNKQFLAALAKKHQVIVFNNRNVAGSRIKSKNYKIVDLANDTSQLIKVLHLQKTAVVGISMGGMIAQQLAVLHPDQVSHLILINTVVAGKQAVHPDIATEKILLNMPANKLGRYYVALKLFFPSNERMPMGVALAFDRFQPKYYTEIQLDSVIAQQRALVMHWIQDDATAMRIAKLQIPVLILNGMKDSVIPPVNSVILASIIPHAQLQRWKNGGHAMIYQYPDDIAEAISRFCS